MNQPFYIPNNNTVKKKETPTIKFYLYIIGLLLIFGVAFLFTLERIKYLSIEKNIQSLEQQKKELLSQIVPLQLEYQSLTNYETLYHKATQNYNLVYPSDKTRFLFYKQEKENKQTK